MEDYWWSMKPWSWPHRTLAHLPGPSHDTVAGWIGGGRVYESLAEHQLIRWDSNGRRDFNFNSVIGTDFVGPTVQAIALLPDGALLVSTRVSGTVDDPVPPVETRRLVRIPPDSDARLQIADLGEGGLRVQIATQPGKSYQIRSRPSLGAAPTVVGVIAGDGYGQELRIEADGAARFIDYEALLVEPW
jgi:hypothetical protein